MSRLTVGSSLLLEAEAFDGLRPRGLRHGARNVGQTVVGRCLAFLGLVGQCASTHSFHALECPEEICAARRALLYLVEERADGPR